MAGGIENPLEVLAREYGFLPDPEPMTIAEMENAARDMRRQQIEHEIVRASSAAEREYLLRMRAELINPQIEIRQEAMPLIPAHEGFWGGGALTIFGGSKEQQKSELKKLPKNPGKPEETKPEIDAEYLELAEAVGVDSPIVMDDKLKHFLKAQKIFVFDVERVEGFLKREANKKEDRMRYNIVWKPIRQADVEEDHTYGEVYNKAIPGHALAKAKTIIENFSKPGCLIFEVSDYEVQRPDPFMSVRIKGSKTRFVFAHWDEPNFRMED